MARTEPIVESDAHGAHDALKRMESNGATHHDAGGAAKTGVLLLNTGTPDAPEEQAIAAYLKEFLMDPAIIGAPRPIRRIIVNRIAKARPAQTIGRYREFWTDEGAPFLLTCQTQARLLEAELNGERIMHDVREESVADTDVVDAVGTHAGKTGTAGEAAPHTPVVLAMRYGNPSVESGLGTLRAAGCTRVIALPAYPQYVNVCAGTCLAKVRRVLRKMGWSPELVEVRSFYDEPLYREALARSVRSRWNPGPDSVLIVSCHSTLLKDIEHGDPYRSHVEATARNLAADLGLDPRNVKTSYQSRFDSRKWLQPSTESLVRKLAETGVSDVAVVCPIFTADNLETCFDVDRELRAVYEGIAGPDGTFTYIPCLNDDPLFIKALAAVCRAEPRPTSANAPAKKARRDA